MIPQVEDPHPRAAWFADERIVAAPPLRQFKSEEIRNVVPIVTDEDARPAILGNGVTGSQGVRPSTCLESREALELGLRQAFLLAIPFPRRAAPLLMDRGRFCGIIDTEKLWLGHADRLFAAESSARRRGGADPEDLPARPLVVDHLVVGHVLETPVEQRLADSVTESLPNLVPGHGHRLAPQNIFDGLQRGHGWTLVRNHGCGRRHQQGGKQELYINSLLNEVVTVNRRTCGLTVKGSELREADVSRSRRDASSGRAIARW